MKRMEPAILRFTADVPDSAELRYYLRHAGALLAASDIECPQRATVLRRARAWLLAALCGIDQHLQTIEPAVPDTVTDRGTDTHVAPDDLLIPTLALTLRVRE